MYQERVIGESPTLPNQVVSRVDPDDDRYYLLVSLFVPSSRDTDSDRIPDRTFTSPIRWNIHVGIHWDPHVCKWVVHDKNISKSIPKMVGWLVYQDEQVSGLLRQQKTYSENNN